MWQDWNLNPGHPARGLHRPATEAGWGTGLASDWGHNVWPLPSPSPDFTASLFAWCPWKQTLRQEAACERSAGSVLRSRLARWWGRQGWVERKADLLWERKWRLGALKLRPKSYCGLSCVPTKKMKFQIPRTWSECELIWKKGLCAYQAEVIRVGPHPLGLCPYKRRSIQMEGADWAEDSSLPWVKAWLAWCGNKQPGAGVVKGDWVWWAGEWETRAES